MIFLLLLSNIPSSTVTIDPNPRISAALTEDGSLVSAVVVSASLKEER